MDIVRCPKCSGRKVYIALGGMSKDCERCDGIGHIEHEITQNSLADFKAPIKTITQDGNKITVTHRRKRRTQAEMQRVRSGNV